MTQCGAVTGAGRSGWQSRSSSCLPWSGSGRPVTCLMALANRPRRYGSPRWIPRASSATNASEFYTACPYENLHRVWCTQIDTPYFPRGINPPRWWRGQHARRAGVLRSQNAPTCDQGVLAVSDTPNNEARTVALACRAPSGLPAGIARWARSWLRGFPISPPTALPRAGEGRFVSRWRDLPGDGSKAGQRASERAAQQTTVRSAAERSAFTTPKASACERYLLPACRSPKKGRSSANGPAKSSRRCRSTPFPPRRASA